MRYWHRRSYYRNIREFLEIYPPAQAPRWHDGSTHFKPPIGNFYPMTEMNIALEERGKRIEMAKGTRQRGALKKGEYEFVRLSLSTDEKIEAKSWFEKNADTMDKALQMVMEAGHKVSFSYNETNKNVTCTFTGKPEESVNEYKMLTSFASSWWQALATNLFKYHIIFANGIWENMEDADDFG